jgi:hypothetical protein
MGSIQLFSNNKTLLSLEGHNFLSWAQNQVLYRPGNAMVEGASKLFEDLLQKMHGY